MLKTIKLLSLLGFGSLLVACSDLTIVEEDSSSLESSQTSQSEEIIQELEPLLSDQRFVPEFNLVEADLLNKYEGEEDNIGKFRSDNDFSKQLADFQLLVDEMRLYYLKDSDEPLVLIMNLSITNLADQIISYPIDQLKLMYSEQGEGVQPDSELYPSASGELLKILESVEGEIGPDQTVEGYLAYSLTEEEWSQARLEESFFLRIPEAMYPSGNLAVGSGELEGKASQLYLPYNQKMNAALIANQQRIQDRLSAEWWGEKELLAQSIIPIVEVDGDVSVTLTRIELSNFTARKAYQKHFRNFPDGQIVLTVEFLVDNQTESAINIQDGQAYIEIMDYKISNEDSLNGPLQEDLIYSGQTAVMRKVFLLDKELYQEEWQGQMINIHLIQSLSRELDMGDKLIYNQGRSNYLQWSSKEAYQFNFQWRPVLERFINRELENVESLNNLE